MGFIFLLKRFLRNYLAQDFEIFGTKLGYYKLFCVIENRGVYIYFSLLFPFSFFHLSLLCNAYGNFTSKISQELLDIFGTKLGYYK